MTDPKTFTLPVIADRTFTRETVALDGFRYERCNFAECVIQYSGGPADVSDCIFAPNTMWDFRAGAALTIETLKMVGFRVEYGAPRPNAPVLDQSV